MTPPDRSDQHSTVSTVTTNDGVPLAVHDFGHRGTNRRILAAHATGFAALAWTPLVRALSDAHVIAPDFRGHGASRIVPDGPLDWPLFGDDVLATIDAAGWDRGDPRPIGIGHSMGGAALLLAEQRRPGTFAGLWVYEPIIFPPTIREHVGDTENPLAAGARRRRPVFASREEARATYASKPPMNTFAPEALAGYVDGGFVEEPDGTVRLACRPEDESRVYTLASTCDAYEHLDAVACPVVVARGVVAEQTPAAIADLAAAALPHGRLAPYDDLSHFGPMEAPSRLAADIDAFIDSLER